MKLKKFNIYKIFALMLLASATLFYACNQEEDVNIQEQNKVRTFNSAEYNVSVINNSLLSFETREDYEQTIDYLGALGDESFEKWESEIGFTNSMRRQYTKEVLVNEKLIEDDLLATMLNIEGTIQIGNDLFKIDMVNEEVSVTKANQSGNARLSSSSANTRSYSTNDNVFDVMDGKSDINTKRRYCKKSKIVKTYDYNKDNPNNPNENVSRIQWKIVYQNAGIYHSLQSKIKKEKVQPNSAKIELTSRSGSFWRNKKSSSVIAIKYYGGYGREYNYRPYARTRRLKDYYFSVSYKFDWIPSQGGNRVIWTDILSISCQK